MNEHRYFTERESGETPRTSEEITESFWGGIVSLVESYKNNGYLAEMYPERCEDSPVIIGCNSQNLGLAVGGSNPTITWPLRSNEIPPNYYCFDLIEFFHDKISKPRRTEYHDFFKHNHYITFNTDQGRREYRDIVNTLFSRNNLAFEFDDIGKIRRLLSEPLQRIVESTYANTEDEELNKLLENAKEKIRKPEVAVRKEAVDKLWDAFERLKTLEKGKNKREKIETLLKNAIPEENIREFIDAEAIILTEYGNKFQIRHTETDTIPLERSEYIDYLFHRLFSLIAMLLKCTGRIR
ncbi:AbiJ-NTD4 domain-containing protein [candidate division KSB1 bacterium]